MTSKQLKTMLLATGLLLITSQAHAQLLVTVTENGSFEQTELSDRADTLDIAGWTIETAEAASAAYAIVDDTVFGGNRALRIDVTTAGSNQWDIQVINELFEVIPGQSYDLSLWARSDGGGTANFTVGNPAYQEFGRIGSDNVALTDQWQEFTLTFSPGASDTVGRAPLHFSFSANEGRSIWIDSLVITTEIDTTGPLDPIAKGKKKWLGNVYSSSQFSGFTEYWNQVTPENAGKWGSVEATRDQMNWTQLDAAYALAKDNGFPFRFHVLVWGNQQPAWMKGLSAEEQLAEITEWFEAVADRYPDIDYLEVVNEPLHDPPTDQTNDSGSGGYIEALGGEGISGWDWVIKAFEMAREIFPEDTKLMINDYNIVNDQNAAEEYVELIKLLQDRRLIDRVGVQAHAFSNGSNLTSSSITGESQRAILDYIYNETELNIIATEMDIDGNPSLSDGSSQQFQLEKYQEIFPAYWSHPAVEGITLWGWRPGLWRNDKEAFIVNENGDHRLAMDWLRAYVDTAEVELNAAWVDRYDPIAEYKPKFLGSAYSADQAELFFNYWNQITPENAGKWGSVEGARDQMNWAELDAMYALAKQNRVKFRFHVLVWGAQQPSWMNDLPEAEQLEEIEEWINAVAERYPDVDYVEVVNEPLHQRPDGETGAADYWDALGGPGETGWDWIIKAFEIAREAFPDDVKLMINDYGIISSTTATYQYSAIINLLKDRDLIDAIGVQAHAFNNGSSLASGTTPTTIKRNLDLLGELGLPIQATELDIDGNPNLSDRDSEAYQLDKYQQIFPVFWEHPKVEGVTLWGWKPGLWRSDQEAWIFDQRPKDAMDWLIDYVDTVQTTLAVSNELVSEDIPTGFVLHNNYPNPFNPSTNFQFTVPAASQVSVKVYDITGRLVQTVKEGFMPAGTHTLTFNASNLATGMYFYELRSGNFREVKKMTLIK